MKLVAVSVFVTTIVAAVFCVASVQVNKHTKTIDCTISTNCR